MKKGLECVTVMLCWRYVKREKMLVSLSIGSQLLIPELFIVKSSWECFTENALDLIIVSNANEFVQFRKCFVSFSWKFDIFLSSNLMAWTPFSGLIIKWSILRKTIRNVLTSFPLIKLHFTLVRPSQKAIYVQFVSSSWQNHFPVVFLWI